MYKLIKLSFKIDDVKNKERSEKLMLLCHSVQFFYKDNLVLCYAFIDENTDLSIINDFPVQNFDFDNEELKEINEKILLELDYLNGIKKRQEINYGI